LYASVGEIYDHGGKSLPNLDHYVVNNRARLRGHDSNRLREKWERSFSVGRKQALKFQPALKLLESALQLSLTVLD
jgi:hypothetical protein